METSAAKIAETHAPNQPVTESKRGRKGRQQAEEIVRYFLAGEASTVEKPSLGTEVPSEGEALVKAFQSKSRVVYAVIAYTAEAEMQGGVPTLVKRPLRK
jgi:hypothetical protein